MQPEIFSWPVTQNSHNYNTIIFNKNSIDEQIICQMKTLKN